jgi:hypothetical protein
MKSDKVLPWFAPTIVKKTGQVGRLAVTFHWRSSQGIWGRFGGGWQWVVGIEVGGSTVLFNLLFCTLRFYLRPRGEEVQDVRAPVQEEAANK